MSRKLIRPNFSEQIVLDLVKNEYGFTGKLKEFPSYGDQNLLLIADNGEKYIVKIANKIEKKENLEFQNAVMNHLTNKNMDFSPQVIKSKDNHHVVTIKSDEEDIHYLRLVTFLPGKVLAQIKPHHNTLLRKFGQFLGHLGKNLLDFDHPVAYRDFQWDLMNVHTVIEKNKEFIENQEKIDVLQFFLGEFLDRTLPKLDSLRTSVIHYDANNYNVIVNYKETPFDYSFGIIDFGDVQKNCTIFELAIAIAYAILDKDDPIAAAVKVVEGYHSIYSLQESEIEILFNLICMRLCQSVSMAAYQQSLDPKNKYISITEKDAWKCLFKLKDIDSSFTHYLFRNACNFEPHPASRELVSFLKDIQEQIHPILNEELSEKNYLVFDLSVGSLELSSFEEMTNKKEVIAYIYRCLKQSKKEVGICRHNEARLYYTKSQTNTFNTPTIHLGIDLFLNPKTSIYVPIEGILVNIIQDKHSSKQNYTLILEHRFGSSNRRFYTLYKNLDEKTVENYESGKQFLKGELLGFTGDVENTDIPLSYVHFQIILDLPEKMDTVPSVINAKQKDIWLSLCPNPNLILKIPQDSFPCQEMEKEAIIKARQKTLGKSLSILYKEPLKIVRGFMQYLFDENGHTYLDSVNNVQHVGHCHPEVTEALCKQALVLNTNSRYLHDNIVKYAEELCKMFPDPLKVCFFVNSGSEANELALQLARVHTNQHDLIVLNNAYHGITGELVNISPYKHAGPGGKGAPSYVHVAEMPDIYRGSYKDDDQDAGKKYAAQIKDVLSDIKEKSKGIAAFISESLLGCGGQVIYPDGYLKEVYTIIRKNGGVCIADEVQVGFGRVGSHFWAFELQDVVPDIVTLGKPIGNGHPLAAVITTHEIAKSFNNGMEFFSTTGGNPVSCAVGLSVLEIIKKEKLQQNALTVGSYLKEGLTKLKQKYPLIGDVRGVGLFIGIELVLDHETLSPATFKASYIVERMKEEGILISIEGPLHNVLKIKPPIVFNKENADYLIENLEKILSEDFSQN